MCGICGQHNFKNEAHVRRADTETMTRSIVHRGPDDEGYFVAGPLGFGFCRLSIIDLAGGHWFQGIIDNKIADSLCDPNSRIYQYLRTSSVRELLDLHVPGRQDIHKTLFSLVLFE